MSDSKTTDDRASPGEISRGRTAVHALKLLAETARQAGYQNRSGESNQEMIGRCVRDLYGRMLMEQDVNDKVSST